MSRRLLAAAFVLALAVPAVAEDKFENAAWQVAASWFLTGEDNSFGAVTPKRPFTLGGDGWGAWELAVRYGQLSIDEDVFPNYAAANSAEEAREWAIGLNWHLNQNVKASLNYLHTEFENGSTTRGDVTADDEQAIFARVQFSF